MSIAIEYQKCKHLHTYSLQSTQALEDRVQLWLVLVAMQDS